MHNFECRHEFKQSLERRLALVKFFVAVLAVDKPRSSQCLWTTDRQLTLCALHVRPDEVDRSGCMLRSPRIERAYLNRDRALEFAPRELFHMALGCTQRARLVPALGVVRLQRIRLARWKAIAHVEFRASVGVTDRHLIEREARVLDESAMRSDRARVGFKGIEMRARERPQQRCGVIAMAVGATPYPGQEQWPAARAWMQAQRAPLASMREATREPILGFPVGVPTSDADARLFGKDQAQTSTTTSQESNDQFPMLELRLPYLVNLRMAARMLAVDMLAAAEEGDGERATRDAEAVIALSVLAQEGRLLVGDFVGMAIRRMALERMTAVLEWKPALLSDSQLARMQAAAMSVPAALQHLNLETERIYFEDVVQRMYTDDGNGDGLFRPTNTQLGALGVLKGPQTAWPDGSRGMDERLASAASHVMAPAAAMYVVGRREMLERYDTMISRYVQDASRPLRDMENAAGVTSDNELGMMMIEPAQRMRWFLVAYLTPALGSAQRQFTINRAQCLATATAFAAERYRRVHGAWPVDATNLVPDFMQSVPEDPWSGKPVLMSNDGDGFRIWSVGRDGVDDRGDLTRRVPTTFGNPEGPLASTIPDVQVSQFAPTDAPTTDWVWFAPRRNLERWN